MSVHVGQEDEYERRHRPIWKELEDALLQHGVLRYSIFLDPGTGDLFAYAEIERRRALGGDRAHRSLPPLVGPHEGSHAREPRRQPGVCAGCARCSTSKVGPVGKTT